MFFTPLISSARGQGATFPLNFMKAKPLEKRNILLKCFYYEDIMNLKFI